MTVADALQVFSVAMTGILAQSEAAARAAKEEADNAVQERRRRVAAIEAVLAAAEPEQVPELRHRLASAQDNLRGAELAAARIQSVAADVARIGRGLATNTAPRIASARAQLASMRRALDGYRAASVTAESGDRRISRGSGHAGNMTGRTGLTELDVSAADLDSNPVLDDSATQGTFGKGGLSRADYRWAVQTWSDIVGPGVARGKTRDEFAARDERTGAVPLRRTAAVYDLFLGDDRIRVDRRSDGSLDVVNGRHRLLIARELGIKTLPGQVSG